MAARLPKEKANPDSTRRYTWRNRPVSTTGKDGIAMGCYDMWTIPPAASSVLSVLHTTPVQTRDFPTIHTDGTANCAINTSYKPICRTKLYRRGGPHLPKHMQNSNRTEPNRTPPSQRPRGHLTSRQA